jgi:Asp-tRNA(Asn)/Glu-tRNA(Gln) amidotransferase A subunit family amidase
MDYRFRAAGRVLAAVACMSAAHAQSPALEVHEASIEQLQSAQQAGRSSARAIVDAYLARIAAYDQRGPGLNAIITVNPRSRAEADALDRERAARGARGPLHGVPVIVKDNYETADLPTTGGALALATLQPKADATIVARLRAAGAVIVGKSSMHELAAGITNVSSLTGWTRNPYDLSRVPGGSSGGSAAAVAASFAAVGLGSDTCGSIRIPAANQNLVGLRPTPGLASRAGIIPLSSTQDVPGPLARSVADLAIVLDVIAGPDPRDALTAQAQRPAKGYREALAPGALRGARIGVLRAFFGKDPEDADTNAVLQKTLDAMKQAGAEVFDVDLPNVDELLRDTSSIAHEFKFDLAAYLRSQNAPVKSLGEILERGLEHEQLEPILRLRNTPAERDTPAARETMQRREAARAAVLKLMDAQKLDAIAYPPLQRRATFIGTLQRGATCQLSATAGLPALALPAGFTADGVPVGLELLGRAFDEPRLLNLAYDWERTAQPRRAPFSTPALQAGRAPQPLQGELSLGSAPAVRVALKYEPTTGELSYRANAPEHAGLVALTLQRTRDGQPGPVVAPLLRGGGEAQGRIVLGAADREALGRGGLVLQLYTKDKPLGEARMPVALR